MALLQFPDGFLWGVATSSHQIEGAFAEDGRGESIWDRFEATPGMIEDDSNAAVACDHYHRWREDVDLMASLDLGAYRFSVAWPRVLPAGTGAVNETGLDFYDALVDALLERGIVPFVTLYHWDLPLALQDRGGWGARETVDAFVEYADVVTARLGDRVRHWITHNEPWCIAVLGHEEGEHAPGHRDPAETLRVAHHVLLSHGRALEPIRRNSPGAEAGIVLNLVPACPATGAAADAEAARRFDGALNRWYLDPIFRGAYPADAVEDRARRGHLAGEELPFVQPGDLQTIASRMDFLGLNYYTRIVVAAGEDGEPVPRPAAPKEALTGMGWEVFPRGLYETLLRLAREYRPPGIYITESGAAFDDPAPVGGRVRDPRRVEYLRAHLAAAHRAIADGVPLEGYFAWSLLDNFEWAHGYTKRFGLVRVEYESQQRIPKDSAGFYRAVAAGNAVDDEPGTSSREET
ncbi:MAG: beta-glucosidase [Candidatus Krumholzibacteriota bacterium]|nr:beta-glucosidase [Candidatus Krumholzibacteriota bacterium]